MAPGEELPFLLGMWREGVSPLYLYYFGVLPCIAVLPARDQNIFLATMETRQGLTRVYASPFCMDLKYSFN
jgi:hypothetical protein